MVSSGFRLDVFGFPFILVRFYLESSVGTVSVLLILNKACLFLKAFPILDRVFIPDRNVYDG